MSRRCYAIWIRAETICWLMGNWRGADYVALPWLEHCADSAGSRVDLPRDYWVEKATFVWERESVGLLISHPSFPETPEGHEYPSLYFREVHVRAFKADMADSGGATVHYDSPEVQPDVRTD